MPDPPPNSIDIDYSEKWRSEDIGIDVARLVNHWHLQDR